MCKFSNRIIFILLFFFGIQFAFSQTNSKSLIFDHLGVTEGLSQSWAITIVQDGDGFIWIGTRDGLNRYDGKNFRVYRSNDGDSTSLNSSHITRLYVDKDKNLWVGTIDGLNVYNREKDSFSQISFKGERNRQIHINDIDEGPDKFIWITAFNGLFQYDPDKRLIEEVLLTSDLKFSDKMKKMVWDIKGNLWIGAENGLVYLDQVGSNRIIQSFIKIPNIDGIGDAGLVNDIVEYPEGIFWIATETGGLFRYDENKDQFENYSENNGLPNNHVRKLMMDPEKEELWIGTRNGLSKYDMIKKNFQGFKHNIGNPNSLSENSIHSLYKDKDGSIWVGTYNGGINIYSESFFNITKYQAEVNNKGLSNAAVSSINEVEPNLFLVGTEGGGLNLYDRSVKEYKHFTHKEGNENSLPHNNVKCIFKDSEGIFWIGTSGGGVSTFHPSTGKFTRYNLENIGIKSDGWVYTIDEDKNGVIWFGLFDSQLRWYDKKDQTYGIFDQYENELIDFDEIRKIFVDSKNRVWVGSDNGLFCYNKENGTFRRFQKIPSDNTSLSGNIVYCIYEDSKNSIWVGTLEGGLNRYDEPTDSFESFQVSDGMPGNNIFGILEDNENNLWLSTNRGISKFNPSGKTFKNYTTQDGFIDTEYGYNAYFKSRDGELFFGGMNGLVSFYPREIAENRAVPPIFITDFRLYNRIVNVGDESGILRNQIGTTSTIELNHNQNVFTLDFSVLNFIKSAKNQFAFRLEGLEDDWNYVKTPSATYTNLEPGTYTFLAKGANNDGFWNHEPAKLEIIVHPAPWETIWAYLAYIIIIVATIATFIRYQKIKVTLEHDLKLREFEHNKQSDLNNAKMKFFTDISHEIRTPLTLMMTPIEDMISKYRSERSLFKQLLLVKNNADRLLRLINQLLDFRKREAGKVRLRTAEGDFIKFIKEICLAFQSQAKKRNISFKFNTDSESLSLYYDRDELEKVFFNLINNAFKYTPDFEKIEVVVSSDQKIEIVDEGPISAVKIEIRDTGIGINSEDIENIFERYYKADHPGMNSLSTGIGLSLSKAIIKDHKGIITCQSNRIDKQKNETIFAVYLRYGKDHLDEEDIIENFRDSEQIDNYLELMTPSVEELHTENIDREIKEHPLLRLLIAEDNEEIRSFLASHLSLNYQIEEATNGREALEIAVEVLPDLVISDVVMPEMDGIQLCAELKNDERTSHIPVIMLTARTSLIHKVEGIDSGADEYLIKPFNLELLKAKIRSLIESRELLRKKFGREITLQPENIVISDPDEKFLSRAKALLEENVANPDFNVNQFIREIGMSRPVLYRKIKAITNMSIFDFINNYRLSKSAIILKTKHFNISEVAFQVGFSDPKYFSKAFRKKFGMTPSEYLAEIGVEQEAMEDNL